MAIAYDDIEEALTHLVDLYAELALSNECRDYQFLIEKMHRFLGTLKADWSEYDKARLDRLITKAVEARIEERRPA